MNMNKHPRKGVYIRHYFLRFHVAYFFFIVGAAVRMRHKNRKTCNNCQNSHWCVSLAKLKIENLILADAREK